MALVGLSAAADQLQIAREFAVLGDYNTARVYYQGVIAQVSRCARRALAPRRPLGTRGVSLFKRVDRGASRAPPPPFPHRSRVLASRAHASPLSSLLAGTSARSTSTLTRTRFARGSGLA
jgi:hypothetical protein